MRPASGQCLEYRHGELFCEETPLQSIAERYGTPLYVYTKKAIVENYRAIRRNLDDLSSLTCYSVKANSNLSILKVLRDEGAGFDIVSGGEMARVLKIHADPSRIVFSGVGKTMDEIDAGLRAGILMFNVESEDELFLLEARARHLGLPAPFAIRVNPDVEAETHPYISTGQTIHKFGVAKEDACGLYQRGIRSRELQVRGVACHIGSQILDVGPFLKAFEEILAFAVAFRGEGLENLDLGGGFGISYEDEKPLEFALLAEGLKTRMRGATYRLILEPGRSIVGNAGLLLTRVLYVKRHPIKNFIVVDSGMSDLVRPALYGSFHEIIPLREVNARAFRADVVGPICETGDFLAQDREMAEVRAGDLLAILTAGAYGYALASNYNTRPRPAEVLVDGSRTELIGFRETVENLMAREAF